MGPLGIVAGVLVWALAFVPAVILANQGKEPCTPSTGTVSKNGQSASAKALSTADKPLVVTQAEVSAAKKRDAMPDAEVSGDGYMSLAPRTETLNSRSTATEVYYSWQAHGGTNCGTQISTKEFVTLINDHIGQMMVATGATCGKFVINNSNAYSLNLNLAFCDATWSYNGCWSR